ncbi:MAG: FAD-dependent oxidoreductase, partial [Chloroflexota bacterium]|nr:FAD-dependent oxidoreductase [Chloroflexota bacterium]
MKRVVICGAGFGGIAAAVELRRHAAQRDLEIVLVDRRADFVMGFRKTWAALGVEPLDAGRRSLHDIAGVSVVTGEIGRIDADERAVDVDGRSIEGDALVLALGARQAIEAVRGTAEFALNVWDRDQA